MKRKNSYPPSSFPKRQKTNKSPTAEIKTLKTKVRRLELAPEVKSHTSVVGGTGTATGSFQNQSLTFSRIPSGTDEGNRIANQITAKKLVVRVQIVTDQLNLHPSNYRVVIFNDKQHNGATIPQSVSMFGQPDSILDSAGVPGPVEVFNPKQDMEFRYKIYRDLVVTMTPGVVLATDTSTGATTEVLPQTWFQEFVIPLNLKIQYDGPSGSDDASVVKNLLQVSVSSTYPTTPAIHPAFVNIQGRLDYIDE